VGVAINFKQFKKFTVLAKLIADELGDGNPNAILLQKSSSLTLELRPHQELLTHNHNAFLRVVALHNAVRVRQTFSLTDCVARLSV